MQHLKIKYNVCNSTGENHRARSLSESVCDIRVWDAITRASAERQLFFGRVVLLNKLLGKSPSFNLHLVKAENQVFKEKMGQLNGLEKPNC